MAKGNSNEQNRQSEQNERSRSGGKQAAGSYDKKTEGPNRPST